MHEILDRFTIEGYEFVTEFDTGAETGGEVSVFVQQGDQQLLHRTFYFQSDNEKHVRAFARKFARDTTYRETCLNGSVTWARVNRWFWINDLAYTPQFITVWGAEASDRRALAAMRREADEAERRLKGLYALIEKRLDAWEAAPAYRAHVDIESQSPEPSMRALDPGIEKAVLFFNGLPGVETQFSCEGIRRGLTAPEWAYGPIWFPAKHQPLAHIIFKRLPAALAAELDAALQPAGVGRCWGSRAEAERPEHNADFVLACEQFAQAHGAGPARPLSIQLEARRR